MEHKKAIFITCFVALLWSVAGLNIKMIAWSPYAIAGGRSLCAVLFLLPVVAKYRPFKVDKYVVGGAVCYALFNYCYIMSTKLTTSANAIILQYTAPIYVALLSWLFLKEKISKADIISMTFVAFGMGLFFLDEAGGGTPLGNFIAVFNGITFAGICIFLHLQKNGTPILSMYLGNVLSVIIGLPFVLKAGMPSLISVFYLVLAGGLFALTYALYARASKGLSPLEIVLIPIIDPVMNPVWVYLILGEKPGLISIVGGIIVLVAVTGRIIYGMKR